MSMVRESSLTGRFFSPWGKPGVEAGIQMEVGKKPEQEGIGHEGIIHPEFRGDEDDSAAVGLVGFSDPYLRRRLCHTFRGCRSMRAENAWHFVFSPLQHEIHV